MPKRPESELPRTEIEKRMDDALKRSIQMPPKRQKGPKKAAQSTKDRPKD